MPAPPPLFENRELAFVGEAAGHDFEIPEALASRFLAASNPHGKPNSDVIRPRSGVADVLRGPRHLWIIDFPPGMEEREAALYALPFAHIRRRKARAHQRRSNWWLHRFPRVEMRIALAKRDRFIASRRDAQSRPFAWLPPDTLPDQQLIVFARDDDWFFGVLHSRFHRIWALGLGTQLREKVSGFRYTPRTCFETFPFPWPPSTPLGKLTRTQDGQRTAIANAARSLDALRADWLGDRTEKTRTLTALYNARPGWLQRAHDDLDEAVADAYGWPADLPECEIVTRLLALNRERFATS